MKWFIGFVFWALVIVGVICVWKKQKTKFFTEYLFFIRYPILLGVFAILFPIAGPKAAPAILGNLFVLEPVGIGLVFFFACLCAWAIIYTALLIWHSAPIRSQLLFDRKRDAEVHGGGSLLEPLPSKLIGGRVTWLSLLLTVPLAKVLWCKVDGDRCAAAVALLVGLLAASLIRHFSADVFDRIVGKGSESLLVWAKRTAGRHPVLARPFAVYQRQDGIDGITPQKSQEVWSSYRKIHIQALIFACISICAYVAAGILPLISSAVPIADYVPALAYLFALFMVVIWLLGLLSFLCDTDRLPIGGLLICVILIWKSFWPSGHEYPVTEWATKPSLESWDVLNQVSKERAAGSLVVVAASGGGITAAYWTTTVLDGIGRDLESRHYDFHRHVAMVSSVSGGSVGAMYYVDAFGPQHVPDEIKMDAIVTAAGASSLSATAWGIAYPDFFRLAVGRVLGRYDRGWAQERRWSEFLADRQRTIGDWSEGVSSGWRPIQLFNVTLQETGERLIIAPVRIPQKPAGMRRNFVDLYPRHDVAVATAARLSATFPYVSPQASPAVEGDLEQVAFHCADGGYYDNSGIVSAVDVIKDWLESGHYNCTARKIALIEIRASGLLGEAIDKRPARDEFRTSAFGPLKTLFSVRTTSQLARNEDECTLIQRLWKSAYGIQLEHFVFRLGADTPLSWHLTKAEKATIQSHWPEPDSIPVQEKAIIEARQDNAAELTRLRDFLIK